MDYVKAFGIGGQETPKGPDLSLRARTPEEKAAVLRFFRDKFGRTKRNPPPEDIYAIPIMLGLFKVKRERGRDPKVVWLC